MSEAHGNDVFIFRAVNHEILERIKIRNINGIAWAHNYFSDGSTESLNMNPSVKRVVFVGHKVYDHHIDHPVISKSTFIFNMFDGRHLRLREFPDEPAVTYTGGLYYSKSFHVLASMWNDILREVPEANYMLSAAENSIITKKNSDLWELPVKIMRICS